MTLVVLVVSSLMMHMTAGRIAWAPAMPVRPLRPVRPVRPVRRSMFVARVVPCMPVNPVRVHACLPVRG